MKVSIYEFDHCNNKIIEVNEINSGSLVLYDNLLLSIDGSTTNTGISIYDIDTETPLYSIRLYNTFKGENKVLEYKLAYSNFIYSLMDKLGVSLKSIYYELPYVGYTNAIKPLYLLETVIPEILLLHKDKFSHIKYNGVNNKTWKRLLIEKYKDVVSIDKVLDSDKVKIKKCIDCCLSSYQGLDELVQDIYDSLGIGLVACSLLNKNNIGVLLPNVPKSKLNFKFKVLDITQTVAEILNNNTSLDVLMEFIPENYKQLGINKKIATQCSLIELHVDSLKKNKRYFDIEKGVRELIKDNSICVYKGNDIDSSVILKYNLHKTLTNYGYVCLLFCRETYKNID